MQKDILSELTSSLQVKVGSDEKQQMQKGKPFPLVLEPADGTDNSFVNLQEYF